MKSIQIVAVILLLATGGADARAAEARSSDFTSVDAGTKALVLLSTSADVTHLAAGTLLRLNRVEIKKNGKKRLKQLGGFFVDNPTVASHSRSEHMNVHWRALDPGSYVLERVMLNPMGCFDPYVAFSFTLAAGDRAYLGDFHNERGVTLVRDSYARDYAFFDATAHGEKPEAFSRWLLESKEKPNPTCQYHL